MTFQLNSAGLTRFLKERELEPSFEPKSGLYFIRRELKGVEFALFFSIREKALHLITYMPFTFEKKATADLARLLHRLNKEVDMCGFGMDEKDHLIFYRTVLPALDDRVDEQLLLMHMNTHKQVIEMFYRVIVPVANGESGIDEGNLL